VLLCYISFPTFFMRKWGGPGEGTGAGQRAVCSLRSVSIAFLRPASMFCPVLSLSCLSRKHTVSIPPKPADSQTYTVPHSFIPQKKGFFFQLFPFLVVPLCLNVLRLSAAFLRARARAATLKNLYTTVRSSFRESIFVSKKPRDSQKVVHYRPFQFLRIHFFQTIVGIIFVRSCCETQKFVAE